MAYMVGSKGKVISVDIQSKMIEKLRKRIRKLNLEERFKTIVCQNSDGDIMQIDLSFIHVKQYSTAEFKQMFTTAGLNYVMSRVILLYPIKVHVAEK